jgi:isopenicillin N synthase-like dioxygenase
MAQSIPVIDMRVAESDPARFAAELGAGFREVGFVGLTHHGVSSELVEGAYDTFRSFFALPVETKRAYTPPGAGGARGYTSFGVEHAKDSEHVDLKEFWQVGRSLTPEHELAAQYPPNPWPDTDCPGFSQTAQSLFEGLERTANRVLVGVASDLGLASDWFVDKVDYGNSILRAIHYPPIEGEPEGVRAGAHEDINVITLLVGSGEPGLEIKNKAGEWVAVSTIPGTIVCNVGDMLQRLTNGVMCSMTHQVKNPPEPWCRQSRYSIPFFMHFNSDFVIDALDSCISADRPRKWDAITADAYLRERLIEIGLLPA